MQLLLKWGFKIKRIEGDREFSTYDIIGGLAQMDCHYTGTIKKTAPIKRIVDDYIDGKCKPVVKHTLNAHPQIFYKLGAIPVYLIMKTDPGKRMRNLRGITCRYRRRVHEVRNLHASSRIFSKS